MANLLEEWEHKLTAMFDEIDKDLEVKYGSTYPLHPSRPKAGTTSNARSDGLFELGASFSKGYSSKLGEGYVIEVRMVTLNRVDSEIREKIEQEVVSEINSKLPSYFPGRKLEVSRDGNVYKIHGDLSLK